MEVKPDPFANHVKRERLLQRRFLRSQGTPPISYTVAWNGVIPDWKLDHSDGGGWSRSYFPTPEDALAWGRTVGRMKREGGDGEVWLMLNGKAAWKLDA